MRAIIFYALLLYVAFSINVLAGYAVTIGCIIYILYKSVPSFYAKKGNAEFNDRNYEKALYYYEKAYKTGRASASISRRSALDCEIFASDSFSPRTASWLASAT